MNAKFNQLIGIGIIVLMLLSGIGAIGYGLYEIDHNTDSIDFYKADAAKWKNHSMVLKQAIQFIPELNNTIYLDDITSGIGRTAYNPDGEFNTSIYEIWCHSGYVWYITVDDSGDVVAMLRVTGATAIKNQLGI